MTPGESVKKYCMECVGGDRRIVKGCDGNEALGGPCPFYPYRLGKRVWVRVFRQFCLQCMGKSREMVSECELFDCACWEYRMGTNPARKGLGNIGNLKTGV